MSSPPSSGSPPSFSTSPPTSPPTSKKEARLSTSPANQQAPLMWKQFYDESNKPYFVNQITGETTTDPSKLIQDDKNTPGQKTSLKSKIGSKIAKIFRSGNSPAKEKEGGSFISGPVNFKQENRTRWNTQSGSFDGLPDQWTILLKQSNLSNEEQNQNPEQVLKVLNFHTNQAIIDAKQRQQQRDKFNDPKNFFNDPVKRLITFKGQKRKWPYEKPTVRELVDAGLHFCPDKNFKDRCKCHVCGAVFVGWGTVAKSPIEEHKSVSPNCPEVLKYYANNSNTTTTTSSSNPIPLSTSKSEKVLGLSPLASELVGSPSKELNTSIGSPQKELTTSTGSTIVSSSTTTTTTAARPIPISSSQPIPSKSMPEFSPSSLNSSLSTSTSPPSIGSPIRRAPSNSGDEDSMQIEELCSTGNPEELFGELSMIGSGGSGSVFVATRLGDTKKVAVKKMVMEAQAKPDILFNEILTMKESQHPNLVNFLDSYLLTGTLWLIMEYVDGASLQFVIQANNWTMREEMIALITKSVLEGLAYLHQSNIIHRDIKSDNILIGLDGSVKITDFGYSVQLNATAGSAKRKSQVGTAFWMAPEVIMLEEYDTKVDIWSTGILALECFEGQPPYYDQPPVRALFLLVNQGRPDFAYADQMTPEFKDFINLCNKMKPAERPTAQEALKHKFLEKLAPSSELADLAPTAKQFSEQEVYNQEQERIAREQEEEEERKRMEEEE